ncbi:MAG: hypothetical protein R3C56_04405 [Pirellulaceae bacterium]
MTEHWARLQLGGQVVQVGQASSTTERRIYYFSLSSNIESTLTQLRQLHSDQSVKTVDVLLPLGNIASSRESGSNPSGSQPSPPARTSLPAAAIPVQAVGQRQPMEESEQQWPDLDRLVDDFDALDL